MPEKLKSYGGQAVIEGVMMRGSRAVAIAMRAPDNNIVIHKEQLGKIYQSNLAKIPFLRGVLLLWDALGLGMKAITVSANLQAGEDEQLEGPLLSLTLLISISLAIGLFFLTPAFLGQLGEHYLHWNTTISNLIEGVIRLALLIGYIYLIGKLPDIKRVFAYHGAEHKTINAHEAGAELTPEKVALFPLEHPRCGTAFLLNVVIISILLFSFFGPLPMLTRLITRVLLIPVIAGIAYEYLKWTAAHTDNPIVRLMIKPNLALQRLTTNEPSLDIIEVSIAAFNAMLEDELDPANTDKPIL